VTQGPDPILSKRQIREIADALASGVSKASLARAYGVSEKTIYHHTKGSGANKKGFPYKPCGTVAAYRRHKKNGELACLPCLDANNLKNRTDEEKRRKKRDEARSSDLAR
jgi:hypothetical protein